ncbi:heterokaryon incompatibility protein-domain-containing protein [Hypomontagnella monticulosa]|nr:heterokaryon incompatibility protein-domain-containing protein [Hypomontagnella monticulosa]
MESQLCEVCTEIPFQDIHDGILLGTEIWEIGTLEQLRQRTNCPLCRLLVETTDDEKVYTRFTPHEAYRITLKWYGPSKYFATNVSASTTQIVLMTGRQRLGLEVTDEYIDISRIRSWIDKCASSGSDHNSDRYLSICPPPQLRVLNDAYVESFRVIDVHSHCIVKAPINSTYVTLSYVWGTGPKCFLLQDNKDELMRPNGLARYWNTIPLTIKDAIKLVRKLGLQYLWVDSLCLVQDDGEDMKRGISVMDDIYEQSLFTLVASGGGGTSSGLPGISQPRKASQIMGEVLPGIRLLVSHEMDALLRQTPYDKRAWTYQEYVLARRKLVFVNNMVYFQCQNATWSEDSLDGDSTRNMETMLYVARTEYDFMNTFSIFTIYLFYYSPRDMTYQSDGLNAMAGLCRRLAERDRCGLLQGIPVSSFDLYLVFQPVNGRVKRREGFPSWSWAGWIGPLQYRTFDPEDANGWLRDNTWIIWYKRSVSGVVSPVWDPDENGFDSANTDVVGYRERRSFQLGDICTTHTTPSPDLAPKTANRPYPMLQFWTIAAFYTISKSELDEGLEDSRYDVYDMCQQFCGFLLTDGARRDFESGRVVELIMLSEEEEVGDGMYASRFDRDEIKQNGGLYWGLYIEWEDGVAERRGICQVYKTALERSVEPGPVWKEIILG